MKPISIDKPCHENWGAMTPSEKGAFCGKCQIDVVDFSHKSATEVKLILQENVGKHMCGRFKKSQLDDLNEKFVDWENQDSRTLQSKFLYALLIVFGMTLFTGCGEDEIIMGDFAPYENYETTTPTDTTKGDDIITNDHNRTGGQNSDKDLVNEFEKNHMKGKVAYQPEEMMLGQIAYIPDTPVVQPPIIEPDERMYVKGEIAYIPDAPVVPVCGIPPVDTTITESVEIAEPVEAIIPVDTDTTAAEVQLTDGTFSVLLFPNPTRDVASIVVIVESEAHFVIELFDITGQRLAPVFSGRLPKGRQQFDIAMAGYKPGNYMVTIVGAGSAQTVKIQRVD